MEAAASYPQCLDRDYPKAPDGTLLLLAWSVGTLIAPTIAAVPPTVLAALANPTAKASMVPALCQWQHPSVVRATEPGGEELCEYDGRAVNFNTQPTNAAGAG